jgi:hypothetical protein
MTLNKPIVVRLKPPAGSDGFWPRENYFAGNASNGYALRLRPGTALPLHPGAEMKLVVANHVPHLPYGYDGPQAELQPGKEAVLLFTCRGKVRLLDQEEVENYVQHGFDPNAVTETRDEQWHLLRQQGRKGDPILYEGELIDRD